MAQTNPAERPSPWRDRLRSWAVGLPYLAFLLLMLYKQRLALQATGLSEGYAVLPANLGILMVLVPWLFLRRGRFQLIGALLLDLVLTVIAFADVLYFRQFGDLTSVASLRFIGQLSTVSSSVTELLQRRDLLIFADLPFLLLLTILPTRWARRGLGRFWERMSTLRLRLPAAALIAVAGAGLVGYITTHDPFLHVKYVGHSSVASRLGLLNYHLFDIGAYGGRLLARVAPAGSAVKEVNDWFSTNRPPAESPLHGVAAGKNVIVLQLESYQAFALGLSVDGQEIAPNLNRLAGESINFTEAYTQTGQGVTSDADLLGNCSQYPTRTGAVYYDYADNDFFCMPDLLRENGYKAVAMQGMRPDFWNLAAVYPQVGFERYFSALDYDTSETIGIGLSDDSFLQQSVEKLKGLPEPYYAYMVTLTSHGPFNFPELPRTLQLGALEGTQMGDYLHAVHYTDQAIGRFVDRLKAEGILDEAVLAVYGDHAGVFRNNTGFAELLNVRWPDEVGITRAEKRVPLMIRLPGGEAAGDRTQVAGQVDIAPTVAGLLGIATENAYFVGRDLLAQPEGSAAFYNGSALDDEHLFWADQSEGAMGRCWNRRTGQEVDVSQCQTLAEEAAGGLHVSRLIIERNLVPDLRTKE